MSHNLIRYLQYLLFFSIRLLVQNICEIANVKININNKILSETIQTCSPQLGNRVRDFFSAGPQFYRILFLPQTLFLPTFTADLNLSVWKIKLLIIPPEQQLHSPKLKISLLFYHITEVKITRMTEQSLCSKHPPWGTHWGFRHQLACFLG